MSMDKTPAELPQGDASDTSVVHSSQGDVSANSRKHTERDISRLQSSIHEYNNSKNYNEDDLVWFADPDIVGDTILQYRAVTDILGDAIETVTTPAGTVTGYLDMEEVTLTGGPVGSVVATGIANVFAFNLVSVTITEGGGGYGVGNTLTVEGTASGATVDVDTLVNFDSTQWEISDGVGSANVKQIFQVSDFPAPDGTGKIHLADNTEYIICAPLTLPNELFINAGYTVMMRAFAEETNQILNTISPSEFGIATSNITGTVTNTFNQTSPNVLLSLNTVSGLQAGQFINFQLDDSTEFLSKEILSVDGGENQIVIDDGGETIADSETGFWDQGAKVLELENLIFNGNSQSNFLSVSFARILESEFFFFHVSARDYIGLGSVSRVGNMTWDASDFFQLGFGMFLVDVKRAFLSQLSFQDSMASITTPIFTITGDTTEFMDFASIVFESNSGLGPPRQFPFYIHGLGASDPIGDNTQIHINSCKDINFVDSIFQTTQTPGNGLDEKDKRVTSTDNGEQKNSLSIAGIELPPDATTVVVNITTAGQLEPVDTTEWEEEANTERFSLNTGPIDGVFTYDGISDQTFVVTYSCSIASNQQNQTLFAGIFHKGFEFDAARFKVSDADSGDIHNVAATFIILLQPGDTLQFGVGNEQSTVGDPDIDVDQVVVTVVRAG